MNQNGENNPSDLIVNSATELLIGASPAQRAEAARNLGRIGNKLASTYLIQSLSDKAPEVRLAAVQVLADLGDPAAIEPLSRLLAGETSPLVDRSAILGALVVLRGRNSTEALPAEVNCPNQPPRHQSICKRPTIFKPTIPRCKASPTSLNPGRRKRTLSRRLTFHRRLQRLRYCGIMKRSVWQSPAVARPRKDKSLKKHDGDPTRRPVAARLKSCSVSRLKLNRFPVCRRISIIVD